MSIGSKFQVDVSWQDTIYRKQKQGKNEYTMKKHDKFLSTFPFNLKKKREWENRFSTPFSSFSTSEIVTCGIWGAQSYALIRLDDSFESLKA